MPPEKKSPQFVRTTLGRNRGGFALIVALSLAAFIFLISISLSLLTTVESATTQVNNTREKAKQNAILAARIALGELQLTTGKDQRITAPASLLAHDPTKALWQGVWDAAAQTPDGEINPDYGDRLSWLVSASTDDDNIENAVAGSGTVLLFKGGYLADTDTYSEVRLSPRDIKSSDGQILGRYAYWIGDESQKVRIGIDAPKNFTEGDEGHVAYSLGAVDPGFPAASGLGFLQAQEGVLTRLQSVDQLELVGVSESERRAGQEHVTLVSEGLLADTQKGGLRQDLTVLLEKDSDLSGPIYGPLASADTNDRGGPNWEQLKDFADPTSYLVSDRLTSRPTNGTQMGVHPLFVHFQIYFSPFYVETGVPDTYRLCFMVQPAAVLWNPYPWPIRAQPYGVIFGRGSRPSLHMVRDVEVFSTNTGSSLASGGFPLRDLETVYDASSKNFLPDWSFRLGSAEIPAGAALVYSAGEQNVPYVESKSSNIGNNVLSPGFRPGHGFIYRTGIEFELTDPADSVYIQTQLLGAPQWTLRLYNQVAANGSVNSANSLQRIQYLRTTSASIVFPNVRNLTAIAGIDRDDISFSQPIAFSSAEMAGYTFSSRFTENSVTDAPKSAGQTTQIPWATLFNVRADGAYATNIDLGLDGGDGGLWNNPSFVSYTDDSDTRFDIYTDTDNTTTVGVGVALSSTLVDRTILFDLPAARGRLFNIGELMHANLSVYDDSNNFDGNFAMANLSPNYAVGNSFLPPYFAPAETWKRIVSEWDNQPLVYDMSYHLNQALWDHYFFSTVPAGGSYADMSAYARLLPIDGDGAAPPADAGQRAGNLLRVGAFNVNSTSVEAWQSLLSSYLGESLPDADGSVTELEADKTALPRIIPLYGQGMDASKSSSDPEAYNGFRSLNEDEVRELAEAIVAQARARGPFLSLADFINRDPDSAIPEHQMVGALQAAIDNTTINENFSTHPGHELDESDFVGYPEALRPAFARYAGDGLPGTLTQADVLQRIGHLLTARGDTFMIRAYGECLNPLTGSREGEAWCELVVQRMPAYVDANSDLPSVAPEELVATVNQNFGRGYRIVSFRWLTENEI